MEKKKSIKRYDFTKKAPLKEGPSSQFEKKQEYLSFKVLPSWMKSLQKFARRPIHIEFYLLEQDRFDKFQETLSEKSHYWSYQQGSSFFYFFFDDQLGNLLIEQFFGGHQSSPIQSSPQPSIGGLGIKTLTPWIETFANDLASVLKAQGPCSFHSYQSNAKLLPFKALNESFCLFQYSMEFEENCAPFFLFIPTSLVQNLLK